MALIGSLVPSTFMGAIGSVFALALGVGAFLIIRWYVRILRAMNKLPVLPGYSRLLGHLPLIKKYIDQGYNPADAVNQIKHKYLDDPLIKETGMATIWAGPLPVTILTQPETAEVVLTNNNSMLQKAFVYDFFSPWLGDGILVANGHKWSHARRMLAPAFHFKVLDNFLPKLNADARGFMTYLETLRTSNPNGIVEDIAEPVMLCALDNICNSVMGTKVDTYSPRGKKFNHCVNNANMMIFDRGYNPLHWIDFIYYRTQTGKRYQSYVDFIREFTGEMVQKRKAQVLKEIQAGIFDIKGKHPVMDTCLIEHISDPKKFTLDDVREEVTTIVFDGHETTGWAMVWAVWLLGHYPEAQRKCQEEIDALFGDDNEKELDMDDIAKLKYMECCMKESQRLYPSVPIIGRHVAADTEVGGYTIPAWSMVFVASQQIHRDERHWSDPDKFYPERFLPENSVGRHPYAHIPFSAGPRNCLGQKFALNEERIVLAHLFRNYNVISVTERTPLMETPAVITRSLKPLTVRLEPRTHVRAA